MNELTSALLRLTDRRISSCLSTRFIYLLAQGKEGGGVSQCVCGCVRDFNAIRVPKLFCFFLSCIRLIFLNFT